MDTFPLSITLVLILLTVFLSFSTGLAYVIHSRFLRTRILMTSFFFFIVGTLSISFWDYALATLPYTIPTSIIGIGIGYILGVQTERRKLQMQGLEHYMQHFAHIHLRDIQSLTWWSVINFYSVMGALVLINIVGLSSVIFQGSQAWAIAASMFGAFLIGTIVPYLVHLWSIPVKS